MAFKRPGVYVSETLQPSVVSSDTPAQSFAAFIEQTYRGPATPTLITSWSQFVTIFGGFAGTSLRYLPYAVYQFFNNGGAQCYVQRVTGSGATSATLTLTDRAATPQNTLKVDAKNPGLWGSSVWVKIIDRSTNRFDLYVLFGGNTDDKVVERWLDLSMDNNDGDCFIVCDTSKSLTASQVITEASTLTASSYAAAYEPWVYMLDPASSVPGATKLVPPGGAVVGLTVSTDVRRGPFKAPAGLDSRVVGAVNLERKHTDQDLDDLNDANVNAIRNHPAGGIVVFGARTLKKTGSDRQISIRRNMIYLKKNSQLLTEFAIFEPNNSTTWGLIRDRLERFLTDHWSRGGLKGDVASEAFYVLCDETINTVQTIDAGELHVEVGVALVYAAEFIVFKIGQWEGGQTAFEV
jgi:hypothetical protein